MTTFFKYLAVNFWDILLKVQIIILAFPITCACRTLLRTSLWDMLQVYQSPHFALQELPPVVEAKSGDNDQLVTSSVFAELLLQLGL